VNIESRLQATLDALTCNWQESHKVWKRERAYPCYEHSQPELSCQMETALDLFRCAHPYHELANSSNLQCCAQFDKKMLRIVAIHVQAQDADERRESL
jgi:hypothetical protein